MEKTKEEIMIAKQLFEAGSMLHRDYKGHQQMLMNEGTFIEIINTHLTDQIKSLESQLESLQKEKQSDAVEFADFLMSDYEMDAFEKGHGSGLDGYLCWVLAGTNQKYTTHKLYEIFKSTLPTEDNT